MRSSTRPEPRRAALIVVALCALACGRNEQTPRATTGNTTSTAPREASREMPRDADAISTIVREFGTKLKMVSLLAPPEIVERDLREHYAPFLAPALLERWIANPASAPGRRTSSPAPERIVVSAATMDSEGRVIVYGEIVESASTGEAQRIPVRVVLERLGGEWKITDFTGDFVAPAEEKPANTTDDGDGPEAAAAVIDDYYAAIRARDYERAYRSWSSGGAASKQSFEEFRNGFADTATVDVRTGTPSRIEPAAGSRYIEIPVEITAKTTGGETQRFRGKYVLRRTVVDGSTAEQRRWHIESAEIARVTS